jgi:hypothetical protein
MRIKDAAMKIQRSIDVPPRMNATWDERWAGPDEGLITCWERGREKSNEEPEMARQVLNGQLVVLPWKGGVEKTTKQKQKIGTLRYLAMWQGLRGQDLNIDTETEPVLTCTATGMEVLYTNDYAKYADSVD